LRGVEQHLHVNEFTNSEALQTPNVRDFYGGLYMQAQWINSISGSYANPKGWEVTFTVPSFYSGLSLSDGQAPS
jgi:hypothetical protein